jgi:hypothetical protein
MNQNLPIRKAALRLQRQREHAEVAEVAGVTRQAVRPHPSQAAKS